MKNILFFDHTVTGALVASACGGVVALGHNEQLDAAFGAAALLGCIEQTATNTAATPEVINGEQANLATFPAVADRDHANNAAVLAFYEHRIRELVIEAVPHPGREHATPASRRQRGVDPEARELGGLPC